MTERRELEACLRHVEKLNAIVLMNVALAHDFDRLFAAMEGHLSALPVVAGQPPVLGLRAVRNGVASGASLIRQLLLLGHMAPTTLQPVDVNVVLRDLVQELVFLMGDTIDVAFASEARTGHRQGR